MLARKTVRNLRLRMYGSLEKMCGVCLGVVASMGLANIGETTLIYRCQLMDFIVSSFYVVNAV